MGKLVLRMSFISFILFISLISFPSILINVNAEPEQEDVPKTIVKYYDEFYNEVSSVEFSSKQIYGWKVQEVYQNFQLPNLPDNSMKCFMDYRTITDTSSAQYELQQRAITDENGFRKIDDRYCVALGTYYTSYIGEIFNVTLDNGKVIKCIVGDVKSDKHTDENHMYAIASDNILEFIVDADCINELSKQYGNMSFSNLEGQIVSIQKVTYQEVYDNLY